MKNARSFLSHLIVQQIHLSNGAKPNASLMTSVSALLHPENKNLTNSSIQSILSIQLYKIHMGNFWENLSFSLNQQEWPIHHRRLQTKNDSHSYLLHYSFHPQHVNNSIPLSQFLRITQTSLYWRLSTSRLSRLCGQHKKTPHEINRETVLDTLRKKENNPQIPFTLT